ncbi:MAG: hypothetical protein MUO23_07420 [Anaerolineales bacterium]|nr:hypothetical protein [Anaerolineales bacterium]
MRTVFEHTLSIVEIRFWQAMATTTGLALGWRQRFRPLQPFVVFLCAGVLTFLLGRLAGQLLLALVD